MSEPDFKAFESFSRLTLNGNQNIATWIELGETDTGKSYLHVDLARYAFGTEQERAQTQEIVQQHLTSYGATPETRQEYTQYIDRSKFVMMLADTGGGASYPERGLLLTDSRTISQTAEISDALGKRIKKDDTGLDDFAEEKTKLHEAAHIMLGLKEPGSDFMAAATMLRDHPESRKMWENEADLRLISGIKYGVPNAMDYGVESYDAIHRALSIPPEQLRSASPQVLHAIAMEYDQKNEMNRSLGANSPEGRIIQTVADNTGQPASLLKKQWGEVASGTTPDPYDAPEQKRIRAFTPDAIVSALEKNPPAGREERRIVHEIKNAIDRLGLYAPPATSPPAEPNKPVPAMP